DFYTQPLQRLPPFLVGDADHEVVVSRIDIRGDIDLRGGLIGCRITRYIERFDVEQWVHRILHSVEATIVYLRTVGMVIEIVVDIQAVRAKRHIVAETCLERKSLSTLESTALYRERIPGSDVDDRIFRIHCFVVFAAPEGCKYNQ